LLLLPIIGKNCIIVTCLIWTLVKEEKSSNKQKWVQLIYNIMSYSSTCAKHRVANHELVDNESSDSCWSQSGFTSSCSYHILKSSERFFCVRKSPSSREPFSNVYNVLYQALLPFNRYAHFQDQIGQFIKFFFEPLNWMIYVSEVFDVEGPSMEVDISKLQLEIHWYIVKHENAYGQINQRLITRREQALNAIC
jgi:hypothetical protein